MSAWWRYFWYWIARAGVTIAALFFGIPWVKGWNRVPKKGGLLILSNHLSDFDPVLVQVGCRRRVRFMGKSELFEMRTLGPILRIVGAFPVKRGEPDLEALKKAIRLLKGGEAVCVFPEGQLSEDGRLQSLKPGVGLIAKRAGVPVICCGLSRTNFVVPYGSTTPRPSFRRLGISWGEARSFGDAASVMEWAEGELRALTGQ